ncbi:tail assembly chaperone gp38 [Dickeya parazeae Ech586]|uniref:Tail assembly chaperone gp38 n=1 Tax=Dickeya zeae (strain Ech586) TaxID=590409 RepID=D2BT15_DICZ5|nr:tail fiber assembly protein [Dickeya parazeae]ACZ75652.1 tail assembly chaperone gp38 [Dickeya parazeae Ech586]
MANYSVNVKETTLDNDGHAMTSGWITVFHVDAKTREYRGASYEYLMAGVGIPANSYSDAPELPPEGKALCRAADGLSWEHVPDYRGKAAYDTQTRLSTEITEPGQLPETLTLLAPVSEFDVWNGKKWVTDKDAQHQADVNSATQELNERFSTANTRIQALSDAVDMELATEEEKTLLGKWKEYRVLLNRVDVNSAPDIDWPEAPAV